MSCRLMSFEQLLRQLVSSTSAHSLRRCGLAAVIFHGDGSLLADREIGRNILLPCPCMSFLGRRSTQAMMLWCPREFDEKEPAKERPFSIDEI